MPTTANRAWTETHSATAPENYERYFVPAIGGPLAADLVARADLQKGERVLDVACGTGVVARLAAERVGPEGTVAGLDVNPGMLDVARAITEPSNGRYRWYETTAESMPLTDASFDVVLCQLGLQFVPDKGAAVREMRRVLTDGGRLLVSLPLPNATFDRLDDALQRHVPPAAGFVQMVFSLNDPARVESLLRDAGFRDVHTHRYHRTMDLPAPAEFFWQYVSSTPLIGLVPGPDDAATAALERDIVTAWQPWLHDGGMRYDQAMLVASARR